MNDYGNRQPSYNNRGNKPTTTAPRKPVTAKGHDAVLKAIQDDGREITIVMQSGEKLNGTVVARDKFTISISQHDSLGGRIISVVYKHAIESFSAQAKSAVTQ